MFRTASAAGGIDAATAAIAADRHHIHSCFPDTITTGGFRHELKSMIACVGSHGRAGHARRVQFQQHEFVVEFHSSSGASKEAVCTARDNLKQSMTDLADPSLLTGGKNGIESAVNKVQKNLDALESAAKTDYKPQVDKVKSSFEQVKTAVGDLGNGKLSDNLQQIGDAISALGTSISSLYDVLAAKCG